MNERITLKALLVATLLTAALPNVVTPAHAQAEAPIANTGTPIHTSGLVVGGSATVYVTPDIARISAGIRTQDVDSKKAAQENADLADAITKAVRAQGVAEQDIRTEGYNISPQYKYDQGKEPVVTGYEVTNSIRVTIRKLADVGHILDAAVKAGANVAGGIEFDLDEATAMKAKDEALSQAVQNAARKAVVMAKAAKAGRIDLESIIEGEPVVFTPRPVMFARAAVASAPTATPVSSGQQTVTASVTLHYSIAPNLVANY